MFYPRLMRVLQHFEAPTVQDIAAAVHDEVSRLNLSSRVKVGQSIAISVGSRGIANIALITRSLVEEFKSLGANPFLVPAMGSHGGGVAENQRGIIESYGVTEQYTGAPIRATMETVEVGRTEEGVPVLFDRFAFEADHVVVVGRVKPHTGFNGEIESGLHKMMLIGLGKHKGAALYHQAIIHHNWDLIVRSVARKVIEKCGVLMGMGIVENQYDQTALIKAVAPKEFFEREKELLVLAKEWMPRLPFDSIDLLIVDQIGKDISGSGMDTNVIGRKYNDHCASDGESPKITRIYVRDLTDETHGNASGLGVAEYAHRWAIEKMDREVTNINCMTGNAPSGAAIPITFDDDRMALKLALKTVGLVQPDQAKVVRIRNTLDLREILASEAYLLQVNQRSDLSVLEAPKELVFDANGNLTPFV